MIMDKMLKKNQVDPRLLPESNTGDGVMTPKLSPSEIRAIRTMFVEANAQLGLI